MRTFMGGGGSFDPVGSPEALVAQFQQKFAGVFDGLAGEATAKLGQIGPAVQAAVDAARGPLEGLKQSVTDVFNNIGPLLTQGITSAIPGVTAGFQQIGQAIAQQFGSLGPTTTQAFQAVTQAAQAGMSETVTTVQTKAQEIVTELQSWPGKFQAAVGALSGTLTSAGSDLVQGLINGINARKGDAVAAATQLANEVAAAARGALGIKSPSKVFEEIGQHSAEGFQVGLEGGFEGVIERAKALATALSGAMEEGFVFADMKNSLKRQIAELGLQYKDLKVQFDAISKDKESKPQRDAVKGQMDQVQSLKDQLSLQSEQLNFSKKYGDEMDSTNEAAQMITKALASMIDAAKGFAMSNIQQFEQDLGISGKGAIPQIAEMGIGWATGLLGNAIDGAFGVGKTEIHVNSVDDALAARQNIINRQAIGIAGR